MSKNFLLAIFLLFNTIIYAGGSENCAIEDISTEKIIKALNISGEVIEYLDGEKAQLAFVGRKGAINDKGIEYTHLGIAWKSSDKWTMTHLLNECGTDISNLYDEGFGGFYSVVSKFDTKVLIPSEQTQTELKQSIEKGETDFLLNKNYSLISNAWSDKYQNCDQYILDVYSYVKSGKQYKTKKELIKWYKENGFEPHKIKTKFFERLLGPTLKKGVKLDDHENKDVLELATVDSVLNFVEKMEDNVRKIEITLE